MPHRPSAAANAQRPITIETAKLAAREGVKATAEAQERLIQAQKKAAEESQAKQEAIDKQKAQQEKLRKAAEGLTGFARRVALEDAGAKTSVFAQRKAAAS